MVATYTGNGRFTQQGTDDNPNTWGEKLNDEVIALFDEAVFGVADIDITGSSNVSLTTANGATDEARHAVLELTGTVGADIDVLVPSVEKIYMVRGDWTGAFTVSLTISGAATSVSLVTGQTKIVYTNGTDIYDLVDLSDRLGVSANLSDLDDASTARTNLGLGTIATQDADSVVITGGDITGITDLTIADGGTGGSTASAARTNLDLYSTSEIDAAILAATPVATPVGVGVFDPATNTIEFQQGSLFSSAVYQGGGDLLITMSETFTDTNYVVLATAQGSTSGATIISVHSKTTTTFECRQFNISSGLGSSSLNNVYKIGVAVFGETV